VRISDATTRERLRAVVEAHRIDLIVSDSLTRFGVRGNGTPEETREFVEWLTELGLGRDLAFLLLHHPRTRSDPGEDELERIAGAWPPHADLILLLKKLDGDRARLSFPKTRWTKGQRPASILAFDPETETFTYVGDDVPVDRDLVAELVELMQADGEWRTITDLRASKAKGGVGARQEAIKEALADERFEHADGETIGKSKGISYYRHRPPDDERNDPPVTPVTPLRPSAETGGASPSPPTRNEVGGDAPDGRYVGRHDDEEIERLAALARDQEEEDT
jgi:hypothetical protein